MIPPDEIRQSYESFLSDGSALDLQRRLAAKDVSLWSGDPEVQKAVNSRLGWLDSINLMQTQVDHIVQFSKNVWENGFRHCVLLGMGGSSLAPELFSKIFTQTDQRVKLSLDVLDNTSPDAIDRMTQSIDLQETLFIVASKSGTTIESDSFFRFFYEQIVKSGTQNPGQHFVAITDPDTALEKLAYEKDFFHCFINPADVGGRFSVLTFFGLVPAVLVGIDIIELLDFAKKQQTNVCDDQEVSSATKLGLMLGLAAENGLDKLVIRLDQQLKPFAAWLEQLVAESTGKLSKGILPLIEMHTDNDVNQTNSRVEFCLINHLDAASELVYSQSISLMGLGGEFFKWEWAIAIAGSIMNINPFDEPNVGENKQVTVQLLQSASSNNCLITDYLISLNFENTSNSENAQKDSLRSMIASTKRSDYFAILAYCSYGERFESLVKKFRDSLRKEHKIISTFGIGPRYLHSTGQLHKGGLNNGVFLIITTGFNSQIDIPDRDYDFAELNRAQAVGDISALKSKQRKVLHIHLPNESKQTLDAFEQMLFSVIGKKELNRD